MKFEGIIPFIWWRNVWCFVPLRATQQIWLGTREWTIQQKLLLWSEKSSFLPQLRFQLFPEKKFNPNGVGGLIVPALFSECKFSLKGVRRSKISWLFLIHYELLYEKFFFSQLFGVIWKVGAQSAMGWQHFSCVVFNFIPPNMQNHFI